MKQGTDPSQRWLLGNAGLHQADPLRVLESKKPPEPQPGSWAPTSPPSRAGCWGPSAWAKPFLSIFLQKTPFKALMELLELCEE